MAIYHLDISTVRRSRGRSVVQLVAYITGTQLTDERTGKTHRRSSKEDYIETGKFGPGVAQEALWNMAEKAERRKDSVVGRHMIVALPHDVSHRKRMMLLQGMAGRIYRDTQAPVVYAMHEDCGPKGKPRNSHGHIVWAARRWDEEQQRFGKKTRELDVPLTGGRIIEAWRDDWENRVNRALPKGAAPISRLSHVRAGRTRKPRKHMGDQACEIERRGGRSKAGDYNRLLDQLDSVQLRRRELESGTALEKDLLIASAAVALGARDVSKESRRPENKGESLARSIPADSAASLVPNPLQADLEQAEKTITVTRQPDGPEL